MYTFSTCYDQLRSWSTMTPRYCTDCQAVPTATSSLGRTIFGDVWQLIVSRMRNRLTPCDIPTHLYLLSFRSVQYSRVVLLTNSYTARGLQITPWRLQSSYLHKTEKLSYSDLFTILAKPYHRDKNPKQHSAMYCGSYLVRCNLGQFEGPCILDVTIGQYGQHNVETFTVWSEAQ